MPPAMKDNPRAQIASFFNTKAKEIENNITSLSDKKYCISIEYKLALVKNPKDADITLSAGPQGKFSGTIIEVPKDPSLTHPFRQIDCINQIKEIIDKAIRFNNFDFYVIVRKEKLRGNSKYHYHSKVFGSNSYSQKLIDFIVNKIQSNPNYLINTRAWFKENESR